jgi:tetratricopeptide (TPR) repeat protein
MYSLQDTSADNRAHLHCARVRLLYTT